MLEFNSDVIKDASSARMFDSFPAVEVLIKRTFLAFGPFTSAYRKPRMFMLFLEMLIE